MLREGAFFFVDTVYIPNFIEIGKTCCGRTDVRTDVYTYLLTDISDPSLMLLGRLGGDDGEVDLKIRLPLHLSLLIRGSSPKSARASPRQCAQSAPDFIEIGLPSAEL